MSETVDSGRAKAQRARTATFVRLAAGASVALLVANCAQAPAPRQSRTAQEQREIGAFPQARYGTASPRVVSEGQSVPKGGGRYHVGNPYRVAGRTYVPSEKRVGQSFTGFASWYGAAFHGRKTANGEIYDKSSITAAHPTMPLPSYARVSNLQNGRSIIVRVNDRGPFHAGRVMDVSERVAWALDFKGQGTARVKVDYLGKAGLAGSDDVRLLASLRNDGQPATSPGIGGPATMVASAEPVRPNQSFRQDAPVVGFASSRVPPPSPVVAQDEDATPVTAVASRSAAATPARPLTPAKGIPAPPDRPFDLGAFTTTGAAPAARAPAPAQALPPVRPRLASLSYAPESGTLSRFQQGNPLAHLPPARFQPRTPATKLALAR